MIPVIIHDSKTPYRLQRLQHIDFSADYRRGLSQLVQQLKEGDNNPSPIDQDTPANDEQRIHRPKNKLLLLPGAFLVLAGIGAFFYWNGNESTGQAAGSVQSLPVENITGNWNLTAVEPGGSIGKGYLKTETTEAGKLNISSAFQFYYPHQNDTLFLQVFNGFAGCKNCMQQREIKLATEDISIASQHYIISEKEAPGGSRARDTLASKGYNQSIRTSCILQFTDSANAVIKVQSAETITLNSGFVLQPFTYTFRFRKTD